MDEEDSELLQLLKLELWAFRRCERLRGYPPDVQAVALALKVKASQAVRDYRANHPQSLYLILMRAEADAYKRAQGGLGLVVPEDSAVARLRSGRRMASERVTGLSPAAAHASMAAIRSPRAGQGAGREGQDAG